MTLQDGEPAPEFDLRADGAVEISTAALSGRPYVIYFYPRDDTPGCTKEAIGFTEAYPQFQELGVEVIGVSKDSISSHAKFRAKHGLCFPLGADEGGSVVEAFGAWIEKSMYGKKYMGVDRATFLVDAHGRVARSWRAVKVPGHVEEVLAAARQLKP
jgi:peroxiredoxin Q/BCP